MIAQSLLLGLAIIAAVVILMGWKRTRAALETTTAVAQE
jgi:hypothetical protein